MSPIIYTNNNNNSEEEGKKYIKFGEVKDKYDKAKKVVTKEFPSCFQPISDLFDCERLNSFHPSTSQFTYNSECKIENFVLNFCILSSLCPLESKLLMDCTNNIIPDGETKIPNKCEQNIKSFGSCLEIQVKEYDEGTRILNNFKFTLYDKPS